jgi:hypothetical protein
MVRILVPIEVVVVVAAADVDTNLATKEVMPLQTITSRMAAILLQSSHLLLILNSFISSLKHFATPSPAAPRLLKPCLHLVILVISPGSLTPVLLVILPPMDPLSPTVPLHPPISVFVLRMGLLFPFPNMDLSPRLLIPQAALPSLGFILLRFFA